ncbi:DUF4237 domain-containing protein [Cryobacterium suzukii]|uniref:DUF4237 domain-containing protein n=1 Tax=Cryobacterium suzukii TaxID=1259198 RepID=A0A4V3ISS4_9MICO|nr:glycohydrolase toxin TNT-related protein [Cryobacterium suzukii]TFD61602.1 DUF4237 domain-containing protein [Cryobacterium suzukii]
MDSGTLDPAYGPQPGKPMGAAAEQLHFDDRFPYGTDAHGNPLTEVSWNERYVDSADSMQFAPNGGAVIGTRVQYTDVDAFLRDFGDLKLDRLGELDGGYMGAGGGTFSERALPLGQRLQEQLHELSLTGKPLPAGWRIEISLIADAYGRPGGGYKLSCEQTLTHQI